MAAVWDAVAMVGRLGGEEAWALGPMVASELLEGEGKPAVRVVHRAETAACEGRVNMCKRRRGLTLERTPVSETELAATRASQSVLQPCDWPYIESDGVLWERISGEASVRAVTTAGRCVALVELSCCFVAPRGVGFGRVFCGRGAARRKVGGKNAVCLRLEAGSKSWSFVGDGVGDDMAVVEGVQPPVGPVDGGTGAATGVGGAVLVRGVYFLSLASDCGTSFLVIPGLSGGGLFGLDVTVASVWEKESPRVAECACFLGGVVEEEEEKKDQCEDGEEFGVVLAVSAPCLVGEVDGEKEDRGGEAIEEAADDGEMVSKVPRHIAVIMDGNGRWAKRRGLPRTEGHRRGADALVAVIRSARKLGVEVLTVYAFSAQNWQRPVEEVHTLMELLLSFLQGRLGELLENGVRLRAIGDLDRLPMPVRSALQEAVARSRHNTALTLCLALSYGGREEIAAAAAAACKAAAAGLLNPDELGVDQFRCFLQHPAIPDPDLLIRTSGEMRVSNFLLWQIAYSEIYVTPTLWPDFGPAELLAAVRSYSRRERRFGKVSEQLQNPPNQLLPTSKSPQPNTPLFQNHPFIDAIPTGSIVGGAPLSNSTPAILEAFLRRTKQILTDTESGITLAVPIIASELQRYIPLLGWFPTSLPFDPPSFNLLPDLTSAHRIASSSSSTTPTTKLIPSADTESQIETLCSWNQGSLHDPFQWRSPLDQDATAAPTSLAPPWEYLPLHFGNAPTVYPNQGDPFAQTKPALVRYRRWVRWAILSKND